MRCELHNIDHDGYRLRDPEATVITMDKLFYPKWWLEVAGFFRYVNAPSVPGMDDDPVATAQHADGAVTDDGRFDDGSRIDDTVEAASLLGSSMESPASGWSSIFVLTSNIFVAAATAVATAWFVDKKYNPRSTYSSIASTPRIVELSESQSFRHNKECSRPLYYQQYHVQADSLAL